MGSGATDLWPYVASGPNRTFRPGFDAALRLPETGHSHIVHYSRLVKVSCAGLSCRSLRPLSLRCDCEGLWNEGRKPVVLCRCAIISSYLEKPTLPPLPAP